MKMQYSPENIFFDCSKKVSHRYFTHMAGQEPQTIDPKKPLKQFADYREIKFDDASYVRH